jgi:membrane protease YdiL (CAAX protease family)
MSAAQEPIAAQPAYGPLKEATALGGILLVFCVGSFFLDPIEGGPMIAMAILLGLSLIYRRFTPMPVPFFPFPPEVLTPTAFAIGLSVLVWALPNVLFVETFDMQLETVRALHLFLLVPIAEEVYFRGCLLPSLKRQLGGYPAIFLCSLLFAALHLPSGGGVLIFVVSLLACGLTLSSHSLFYAIQLHIAWNGISQITHLQGSFEAMQWKFILTVILLMHAGLAAPKRNKKKG